MLRTATFAKAAARAVRNRTPAPARDRFRRELEGRLTDVPAEHRFVELPARRQPWVDSGVAVAAGERVTLVTCGRVYLSKPLDLWVPSSFQVWARVGERGPIGRGTTDVYTFTAEHAGRLQLGNAYPNEWTDRDGAWTPPPLPFRFVQGGCTVLVLRWRTDADPETALRALGVEPPPEEPSLPAGFGHLWFLGPARVYADGGDHIACHTHGDAGIVCHDARMPLTRETRLRWSWKVDALPSALPENTLPTHDYLSIAAEFDDGTDLTYHWSAALPVGTGYRCPLPHWRNREWHLVARSGGAELGRWVTDERRLLIDQQAVIGRPPPRAVVRVWLIANSILQRGDGRCAYRGIELLGEDGAKIAVGP